MNSSKNKLNSKKKTVFLSHVKRTCNPMVDLSKFTFNKKILSKDVGYNPKKTIKFSLAVRHIQEDLLLYLVNLKLSINLRIIVIDLIIVN